MTGPELQRLLDRAKVSQRGAARILEIDERTMRRHVVAEHVPVVVEFAVRWLVVATKALAKANNRKRLKRA